MVKLRAVHLVSASFVVIIFLVSVMFVLLANFNLPTSVLFTLMNILGTTFPPNADLVDAQSPFILASVALGGIANIAFTITFTTIFYQILVSIDIRYAFVRQRIKGVSNHIVITPINGMSLELSRKLRENGLQYVFIDENKSLVKKMVHSGTMAVHGDPTKPDVLEQARTDKALAVCTLYDDDIKNTFVAIEARRGGKRIRVMSRIKRLEDIPKMERSGARRVILPEAAVGIEMSDFLVANA